MIKFRENEEYGDSLNRYFYEGNNKFTRNITFQITDDCNLCCSYCYQINKGHHKMSFEIAKKWTMPIRNWGKVRGELEIMYPDRMQIQQ